MSRLQMYRCTFSCTCSKSRQKAQEEVLQEHQPRPERKYHSQPFSLISGSPYGLLTLISSVAGCYEAGYYGGFRLLVTQPAMCRSRDDNDTSTLLRYRLSYHIEVETLRRNFWFRFNVYSRIKKTQIQVRYKQTH